MQGRLKQVNSRGYGFIETDRKIDFFFHHTAYLGSWKQLLTKYVGGEIIILDFDNDSTATEAPRAINVKIATSLT